MYPRLAQSPSLRDARIRKLVVGIILREQAACANDVPSLEMPTFWSAEEAASLQHAMTLLRWGNPGDNSYTRILERMRLGRRRRITHHWAEGVASVAEKHMQSLLFHAHATTYSARPIRLIARYAALPTAVARRWLWFANIDFQSIESFIRRLTPAQEESLHLHYHLACDMHESFDNLPCFRDGPTNAVWRACKLPYSHHERFEAKSALAYNFFGWDIGFQKYPESKNDTPARDEFARQFFSSDHRSMAWVSTPNRGEFVVNQETGGVYWYLYRTLRSNALWNTHESVALGTWICPGFYLTVLAWACLLIISPALLFTGLLLWMTGMGMHPLYFIGGAITPLCFGLHYIMERARGDDEKLWRYAVKAFGVIVVGLLLTAVTLLLYRFHSYYAFILLVLPLAVGRLVTQQDLKFWEIRVVGRAVLLVFLGLLANDIWRYTMMWEILASVVVSVLHALLLMISRDWMSILAIGFTGVAYLLAQHSMQKSKSKIQTQAQQISKGYSTTSWENASASPKLTEFNIERLLYLCVGGPLFFFLVLVLYLGLWVHWTVYAFAVWLLLITCAEMWSTARWSSSIIKRNQIPHWVEGKESHAILNNPFWWDGEILHRDKLDALQYWGPSMPMVYALLKAVRNDKQLRRASWGLAWLRRGYATRIHPDPKLIYELLQGNRKRFKQLVDEQRQKTLQPKLPRVRHVFMRISEGCHYVWRMLQDWLKYYRIINESCPRSPDQVGRHVR